MLPARLNIGDSGIKVVTNSCRSRVSALGFYNLVQLDPSGLYPLYHQLGINN